MGILSSLFGTGDIIEKGMDLIDKKFPSDIDKIEAKTKAKTDLLTSYAPFKVAQRLLAGGVVACAVFLGREIAQHEYRLALKRGWVYGRPKPVRWYEGTTTGWTVDSVLDVVAPAAACLAVYSAGLVI